MRIAGGQPRRRARMATVHDTAGLKLTPTGPTIPLETLEFRMETLADAEHEGWMAHRAATRWTYGHTRNDAAKIHPV
jgi:hypothetical protein